MASTISVLFDIVASLDIKTERSVTPFFTTNRSLKNCFHTKNIYSKLLEVLQVFQTAAKILWTLLAVRTFSF